MPSTISAGTTAGTAISVTGDTTGNLAFQTNGTTTAMTITTAQNVGIGTTTPVSKLDVFADTATFGDTGSFNFAINGTNILFKNGAGATTECMRITSTGDLRFNSGYGSVATAYGCRAWVNFNGTGTVAIRASGNVSSITDNGTGDYTVNFTTAMTDANYAIMGSTIGSTAGLEFLDARGVSNTTTSARFGVAKSSTSSLVDDTNITLAIFR